MTLLPLSSVATLLVAVMLAAPPAAEAAAQGNRPSTARDSGPVTIRENRDPIWRDNEGWRIDSMPVLDIGPESVGPGTGLSRVGFGTRLSDGRIVVAQMDHLKVLGPNGTLEQRVELPSSGAGPSSGVSSVVSLAGDSILVIRAPDMMILGPRGDLVLQTQVRREFLRDHAIDRVLPTHTGDLILVVGELSERTSFRVGVERPRRGFIRVARDGSTIDTLGFYPGTSTVFYMSAGRRARQSVPLLPQLFHTVAGAGLYVGTSERYEIHSFRVPPGGEPERMRLRTIVRREHTRQPFGPSGNALIQQRLRASVAASDSAARPALEARIRELELPTTFPAFANLIGDRAGNLWVMPSDIRRGPAITVFDSSGQLLGDLALPLGRSGGSFTILEIGDDYLLVAWHGPSGEERLRIYRITRP